MHENATDRAAGANTALPHGAKTAPSTRARLCGALRGTIDMLLLWQERRRQRQALAMLSDDLLKDIGISRLEAHSESTKCPWDA